MTPLEVVQTWQNAVNKRDVDALLERSTPEIEILGPRGLAQGHTVLRQWLERAGLSMTPLRYFAGADRVAVLQRGVWRSSETGTVVGDQPISSAFRVVGDQVRFYARFDTLEEALELLGLERSDEVRD